MESLVRMFRDSLFNAFYDWLERNMSAIGEKWYAYAFNKAKKAEDMADNAVGIIGAAMWMFNTIANCGVMAGVGPEGYSFQYLENPKIDEASSKRLLLTISACLNLQHLPHEEQKAHSNNQRQKVFAETLRREIRIINSLFLSFFCWGVDMLRVLVWLLIDH
ncbi:MAG: hypothetical protein ACUVTE_07530 [Candidatus Bathycorpusculaceae bacterium]